MPNVARELPVFRGYTVDFRLEEFRKIEYGKLPEFIPFSTWEGHVLFEAMEREGCDDSAD